MARFQDRSGMSESAYQGTPYDDDEASEEHFDERYGATGDEPTVGYRIQGGRTTNRPPWTEVPAQRYTEDIPDDAPPGEPWGGPMYGHMYMLERTDTGGMNTDRWRPDWEVSERPNARDWRGLYDEAEERRTRARGRGRRLQQDEIPEHGTSTGPHVGRGPRGWVRADVRVFEDVCQLLTDDARVDATDITVEVRDGEVTLKGTVADRRQKRRAEDIAWDISGVRDVHNQLRIKGGEGA